MCGSSEGQSSPISSDEYILRRILNRKDHYDPLQPNPVARAAVSPTRDDIEGISVYREHFVTAQEVAEDGENVNGYFVARFQASDAIAIGLTLVPDPIDGELPGHALIPELGLQAKKLDKNRYKSIALEFTKILTNIVYSPA